jgi:hypothetical protein
VVAFVVGISLNARPPREDMRSGGGLRLCIREANPPESSLLASPPCPWPPCCLGTVITLTSEGQWSNSTYEETELRQPILLELKREVVETSSPRIEEQMSWRLCVF